MSRRIGAAIILAGLLVSWGIRFSPGPRMPFVFDKWTGEMSVSRSALEASRNHNADWRILYDSRTRSDIVSAIGLVVAAILAAVVLWPARAHKPSIGEMESGAPRLSPSAPPTSGGHPWIRYLARIFDFAWFGLAITAAAYALFPNVITAWRSSSYSVLYSTAVLCAWCLVEPIFLMSKGATPGKWMCGVRLEARGDWTACYATYFERSAQVLGRGMFLGIPPMSLVAMFISYRRLLTDGATHWDRNLHIGVVHQRFGIVRFSSWAVLFSAIIFAFVYLYGQR